MRLRLNLQNPLSTVQTKSVFLKLQQGMKLTCMKIFSLQPHAAGVKKVLFSIFSFISSAHDRTQYCYFYDEVKSFSFLRRQIFCQRISDIRACIAFSLG